MSIDQKVQLSIIILLTGLVIVFVMLIFLTYVIKGYGAAVRALRPNQKDQQNDIAPVTPSVRPTVIPAAVPTVQAGISEETVAAISAAVYFLYGASAGKVTSIRRSAQPSRSAWGMAGLFESTRPF